MPFCRVKVTSGKDVEGRTAGQSYVSDDEAWMVSGQSIVDGVRKNSKAVVEEEDEE